VKIESTDRILAIIDEMGKQRFFVSDDTLDLKTGVEFESKEVEFESGLHTPDDTLELDPLKAPFDDNPRFHGDKYIKPSDWDNVKVNMLMTEDEDQALEAYSKSQVAVLSLIKREKKYNFLGELANTYGELAHEVNNRIELTKMMDPGAIAIAVQLLLSSFELIEKASFDVKGE
jgi:hypothetical protein